MMSASSMHEAGNSKMVLNLEGWSWEGSGWGFRTEGTNVNPWLIHVDVWQKPPQYCKVVSFQ